MRSFSFNVKLYFSEALYIFFQQSPLQNSRQALLSLSLSEGISSSSEPAPSIPPKSRPSIPAPPSCEQSIPPIPPIQPILPYPCHPCQIFILLFFLFNSFIKTSTQKVMLFRRLQQPASILLEQLPCVAQTILPRALWEYVDSLGFNRLVKIQFDRIMMFLATHSPSMLILVWGKLDLRILHISSFRTTDSSPESPCLTVEPVSLRIRLRRLHSLFQFLANFFRLIFILIQMNWSRNFNLPLLHKLSRRYQ